MMYTRIKIKHTPAEKTSPSYTKEALHSKLAQTKSLYRSPYPEHTKIITETAQTMCGSDDGDGLCAHQFFLDTQENNGTAHNEEYVSSFGRVVCALFSVFLGAALIYLSEVNAPEYVDRLFMTAYDAVTERYTEVIAAQPFSQQKYNSENGTAESSDVVAEINVNTEQNADTEKTKVTTAQNFYGNTENSYIADIAGAIKTQASVDAVAASGVSETPLAKPEAVTVSKNLSPGSDKIYIMNETTLEPDLDSLAAAKYPIMVKAGEESLPRVLIVHTHGTEAYSDSTTDGTTRTTDTDKNVVRVGRELAKLLNLYGIPTLHSETMHDEISYITSYNSSKKEVQNLLAKHPSIKYVIDVHRDAIPNDGENRVKPLAEINGENTAQLMLVVGTNAGGGNHPDYIQNLTVASHLQKSMNDTYPGLARPVNIRSAIFNQNVCSGAFLLEVGSDANTLDEALAAVRLFARSFAAIN